MFKQKNNKLKHLIQNLMIQKNNKLLMSKKINYKMKF